MKWFLFVIEEDLQKVTQWHWKGQINYKVLKDLFHAVAYDEACFGSSVFEFRTKKAAQAAQVRILEHMAASGNFKGKCPVTWINNR